MEPCFGRLRFRNWCPKGLGARHIFLDEPTSTPRVAEVSRGKRGERLWASKAAVLAQLSTKYRFESRLGPAPFPRLTLSLHSALREQMGELPEAPAKK